MLEQFIAEARVFLRSRDRRGPPGPPPAWNPELIWRPETSRWVLPEEVESGPIDDVDRRMTMIDVWKYGALTWGEVLQGRADEFYEDQRVPKEGPVIDVERILSSGKSALVSYIQDSRDINAFLRAPGGLGNEHLQKQVDAIIDMMEPFSTSYRLFRGQGNIWYENLKVGEGLILDGITSMSRIPAVAVSFGSVWSQPGSFLELDVSPKVSGLHMIGVESETILQPGSVVQVQQIEVIERTQGSSDGRFVQIIRGRIDA